MKRDEVRQVDQIAIEEFGISGVVLMENAGRGATDWILKKTSPETPVGLLCGGGNNGGDGYVIARHLELAGRAVRVISMAELDVLKGDAAANAAIASKSGIQIEVARSEAELEDLIRPSDCLVDCLLGTGATGEPRGLYATAVQLANDTPGYRVAIDLPTGLDCDSGEVSETTFRADLTLTFVAAKAGFSNPAAAGVIGEVQVVGIGAPKCLLEQFGVF
ncbi:NAD(P)H-hydrate epimerase [Roseiconus lacunae]|uniref:NAD(P)H-hydrate epimerase n=1 Tax=Roseiconus lacunae TaxID=2605694 RepID=A0ABT7PCL0_9BACT|nr:NAD(P)H-hydrate epimerase [Roseiconus lacunae]MDM4013981.1 NAD(P)H-hydrate epimerase [Roseiconus lacunae]